MTTNNKFWEDGYEGNNWNKYVIQAPTFKEAAEVASKRSWWLHSWTWVEGKDIAVFVNEDYLTGKTKNAHFKVTPWNGNGRNYRL